MYNKKSIFILLSLFLIVIEPGLLIAQTTGNNTASLVAIRQDYTSYKKNVKGKTKDSNKADKWDKLLRKYEKDKKTKQILLVKYSSGSLAQIEFYEKNNNKFKLVFSEEGYVGKKGINKVKEGDLKTPTGTYNLTTAFGIKAKPKTKIKYIKLNSNYWWCSDSKYYNQMINIKKKPHRCKGEHLINYGRAYNYCLVIDYNKKCKYPKGSAIFLHCSNKRKSTSGCVAISEKSMKKILSRVEKGAKICIYKK